VERTAFEIELSAEAREALDAIVRSRMRFVDVDPISLDTR